jgi:small subunit ribosomal protein S7
MNSLMYDGKKSVAEGIVYGAFDVIIETKTKTDPLEGVPRGARQRQARRSKCVAPRRRRHLSGAGRSAHRRRQALAIRWIITPRARRNEPTMVDAVGELLDAANNRGNAVKKREDTHKMAEANRAFSHYRW